MQTFDFLFSDITEQINASTPLKDLILTDLTLMSTISMWWRKRRNFKDRRNFWRGMTSCFNLSGQVEYLVLIFYIIWYFDIPRKRERPGQKKFSPGTLVCWRHF